MANTYRGIRCDNGNEVVGTLLHVKGTPIHYIIPTEEISRIIVDESRGAEINIHAHRVSEETLEIISLQEDIRKIDDAVLDLMADVSKDLTSKTDTYYRLSNLSKDIWAIK